MNSNSCLSKSKSLYEKNRKKSIIFLISLLVILLIAALLSLYLGSMDFSIKDVVLGIFGKSDDKVKIIIRNNRLPRVLTAIVCGAGLGLTGCIMQVILQNPLASLSTIGVSQGASFGAAVTIVLIGLSSGVAIPMVAFLGSLIVAIFILLLSNIKKVSKEGIVLAGVAISAMLAGATSLIQYFADEVELATLVYWTFGDLSATNYQDILIISLFVMVLFIYSLVHRWDYNVLLTGQQTSRSLGINVKNFVMVNIVLCCLAGSSIVSNVGLINFIGLIAPHIVRKFVGNNHVYLIPGSLLGGAIVLILSDLISRVMLSPVILPIGAITSFLGGPIFLYLLLKDRRYK